MARQQGHLASVADSLGYSRTLTNAVMQRTWTVQQEVNTRWMSPMHRGCARVGNPSQQGRLAGAPVCGGHPQLLQDPHHQQGGDRGQGKAANIQGSSANMQQQ